MSASRKSVTLDWLAYTIHWNTEYLHSQGHWPSPESIADVASFRVTQWIHTKPLHGYTWAVSAADNAGLRVMGSERNSPMGVHVSWSGQALATVNPRALLRQVLNVGGSVRRIDLAFDVAEDVDFRALYNQLANGEVTTRARQHQIIESNTGTTIYVGSRTSDRFLRIYDKGAEQRTNDMWTRIELECKSDYAVGIAQYIDQNGYDGIPEIIRAFARWEKLEYFDDWFNSPTLFDGLPKKEKTTDTRRWLMDACAPALARVMRDDTSFYVRFLDKVMTLGGVGEAVGEVDIFDGKADFDPS